jgi:hypothetical protein
LSPRRGPIGPVAAATAVLPDPTGWPRTTIPRAA